MLAYINTVSKLLKINERQKAAEMIAFNPKMTNKEIAERLDLAYQTVQNWRRDPNFVDMVYELYMVEFGSEIPAVLKAMIRESKAGNVQAARLVLEHSGKLIKNIINVSISPYEMFLNKVGDAEVLDDDIISAATDVDFKDVELPPRTAEDQRLRTIKEKKKIKKVVNNEEYNYKQREWYKWRKRAEAAGIPPLKSRRPTPAQRKEWQNKIVQAELTANSN